EERIAACIFLGISLYYTVEDSHDLVPALTKAIEDETFQKSFWLRISNEELDGSLKERVPEFIELCRKLVLSGEETNFKLPPTNDDICSCDEEAEQADNQTKPPKPNLRPPGNTKPPRHAITFTQIPLGHRDTVGAIPTPLAMALSILAERFMVDVFVLRDAVVGVSVDLEKVESALGSLSGEEGGEEEGNGGDMDEEGDMDVDEGKYGEYDGFGDGDVEAYGEDEGDVEDGWEDMEF
ncbi:hypothetical protein HDU76_006921, partial [Blyttiomyces sp. JEL0837]